MDFDNYIQILDNIRYKSNELKIKKTIQNIEEEKIQQIMKDCEIECIQTKRGKLTINTNQKITDITKKGIIDILNQYYALDETKEIITYLYNSREYKEKTSLKYFIKN